MRGVLFLVAALAVTAALWMVLGTAGMPESEPHTTSRAGGDVQAEALTSRPVLEGAARSEAAATTGGETTEAHAGAPAPDDPFHLAGAVKGLVVDAGDKPLAGITVHLSGVPESATTLSDDAGRFAFEGLAPNYQARVWAAERGLVPDGVRFGEHFSVQSGLTQDVKLRLVPSLTLHGRVLYPDGMPASGARVGLHRQGYSHPHSDYLQSLEGESGSDGSFRLEGAPLLTQSKNLVVHARLDGYPQAEASLETVKRDGEDVPRDPADPIELILAEPCYVDVLVVSEDTGEGIEGATVATGPYGNSRLGSTGPDGRCHAGPVAPGPLKLTVRADSWGTAWDANILDVEATPNHVPELTLRMFRTYEITGRVVYAGGEPANDRSYGLAMAGEHQGLSTDIFETFRLRDLRQGTYRIAISSHDMEGADVDATDGSVLGRITLEAGTKDAILTLDIPRPVPLELHVTTGEGQPLDHGLVRIGSDDERWQMMAAEHPPRVKDGRATVAGFLQPIWIEVLPLPTAQWAPWRTGPVAPSTPRLDVRLEPARSLSGHAVGPDGPLAGVTIRMDPNAEEIDDQRFGLLEHGTMTTAEDGAFEFPRLWSDSYWMHVTPPKGYARIEARQVTAGSDDFVLQLHRLTSLALPVLDADGVALRDAQVNLWHPPWFSDNAATGAATDTAGIARFDNVDPEFAYTLEIIPPASAPTSRRLWLPGWRPDEHAVRLERAWHLRGVVQNANGSPSAHATVYLERRGNEPLEELRTDEHGRFALPHLAADSVTLWATALVGRPQSPRTKASATSGDVVLRLPVHAGRLEIRLRDWPTLPAEVEAAGGKLVAHYVVWDPDDPVRGFRGEPSPDGSVRLDGLDPSVRWTFFVSRDHPDLCGRFDGLVADGRTYELDPRRAEPIHGRVTAPDQTWPHRVEVVETGLSYDIYDDGAYTITGHPPGTWTLRASASKGRNRVYRTVTATGPQAPPIDFAADR